MELLYVPNLLLAFALQLIPLWFSTRYLRLPPLNPISLVMAINLPVQLMKLYAGPLLLISDGLFDASYQFAVLMGNLLLVAQAAGMVAFYKLFAGMRIERRLPLRHIALDTKDLRRAEKLFVLIFLVAFYLLASAEFGLINWLGNPRLGYQIYRTGQGHWYALAISALSVAMVLGGLANPKPAALLLSSGFYLCLAYVLGSKSILLNVFTTTLIFLWFIRWRHLKKVLLLGAPLIFLLLIWNLYLALSNFQLQSVVSYFDYYKNAADYYRAYLSGELDLFYGEIASSSWWAYAPRSIWPDKPVVYGILLVNEIFYPGQAENTNTPAFGGGVEQFADFGVFGVVFYGFFSVQSIATALLSYLIFRRPGTDFRHVSVATAVLFIVQFGPGFGTFFPGALYASLLVLVVVAIRTVRHRRRKRKRNLISAPCRPIPLKHPKP